MESQFSWQGILGIISALVLWGEVAILFATYPVLLLLVPTFILLRIYLTEAV